MDVFADPGVLAVGALEIPALKVRSPARGDASTMVLTRVWRIIEDGDGQLLGVLQDGRCDIELVPYQREG